MSNYRDYVDIAMCTWSQPNGASIFSIYKWDNDYNKTVSNEPIHSKEITGIADNSTVKFEFDEPLPPDEYLVVINDNLGTKIGIWKVPYEEGDEYDYCRFFINGVDIFGLLPQGNIHYINTPEVKWLKVSEL